MQSIKDKITEKLNKLKQSKEYKKKLKELKKRDPFVYKNF